MAATGPSTLKERIAALQQRSSSPQPISPPRSRTPTNPQTPVTGGLRDKIARFEEKGGTPIPRGSFGLGAPPHRAGKQNNELWANRIPSAGRIPSGRSTGSLARSATLSMTSSGRERPRCVSTSDIQPGGLQLLDKKLGALSTRLSEVPQEEGSRNSDMIRSLDIATRTATSQSFVDPSFGQLLNQAPRPPMESTITMREPEQTIVGMEIRDVPSVLVSSDTTAGLDTDNSHTLQSVSEDESETPSDDAVENPTASSPKDAPLRDTETDAQLTVTITEHLTSAPSDTNGSDISTTVEQNVSHFHSSHPPDTSTPEVPMPREIRLVESVPIQGDSASSSTPALPEPSVTFDEEASHVIKGNLSIPCDTLTKSVPLPELLGSANPTGVKEPQNDGKASGESPVPDNGSSVPVLAEVNLLRNPAHISSTTELQMEQRSPYPPLSHDSITGKIAPSSDATPDSEPVIHSDHPSHSVSSSFVSTSSRMTLDSSMTNTSAKLAVVELRNPTVAESRLQTLTNPSLRPLPMASTSVSEVPYDLLPHVSPILDAFPPVPLHIPSASAPGHAGTIPRHRHLADRSSTSSIKSTPSLSFSSTSSSSTCSPTSSSIAAPQPPPSSRRPAATLNPTKSYSRSISYASLYDDDTDEEEGGWANVVVSRRYY